MSWFRYIHANHLILAEKRMCRFCGNDNNHILSHGNLARSGDFVAISAQQNDRERHERILIQQLVNLVVEIDRLAHKSLRFVRILLRQHIIEPILEGRERIGIRLSRGLIDFLGDGLLDFL